MPPVTGNLVSGPRNPLFPLDESLAPSVARALRAVGHDFVTVVDAFGVRGVDDPRIIDWCRERGAVWVHADNRARRQHGARIETAGIRTPCLRHQLSRQGQLRALSFVLPSLMERWRGNPGVRHYQVFVANPLATPILSRVRS